MDQKNPVALVNDEVLKVGDAIAGFKVEAINQNEVVLLRGIERRVLRLFEQTEKNKSKRAP